jgi:GTP-dependent phosphoenolpyruvate carboxykinase
MKNADGIKRWVEGNQRADHPDRIVYCTGSESEKQELIAQCLAEVS